MKYPIPNTLSNPFLLEKQTQSHGELSAGCFTTEPCGEWSSFVLCQLPWAEQEWACWDGMQQEWACWDGIAVAPFCLVAYIKIRIKDCHRELNQLGVEENTRSLKQPDGLGVSLEKNLI